jgi:nickel-dependent lactate racemase
MDDKTIKLPWGKETTALNLPGDWQIEAILEPAKVPVVNDASGEVTRSLKNPIGSQRISELARKGMKVALVIDDDSRPTPVGVIAPAVIGELKAAGVGLSDITVVPALGVHRPMQDDEIIKRLGPVARDGIKWENHNCDEPDKLSYLGTTKRGTPVVLNRTVAQADLVISIGCIEPHIIASFGGGYKNLVPGVAGRQTIAHNHALNCSPATYNMV